jgi:hypothetical protein
VSGNAVLNAPGVTFILEGGGFTQAANGAINGVGVTLFNAGSKYPTASGGNYGAITLTGLGQMSAPTTGPYAGIVIFQSRDNTQPITLAGAAQFGISGTIYAAAAELIQSGGQLGTTQNLVSLVVDRLTISGNATTDGLTVNPAAATAGFTPAPIRSASDINSLAEDGTNQTITLVDAYNAAIDQALETFDTRFGLRVRSKSLVRPVSGDVPRIGTAGWARPARRRAGGGSHESPRSSPPLRLNSAYAHNPCSTADTEPARRRSAAPPSGSSAARTAVHRALG